MISLKIEAQAKQACSTEVKQVNKLPRLLANVLAMQANEILRIINIAKIVKVNDALFPLPQSSDFCILYSTCFYLIFLGKVASDIIKTRMGKHPDFAQTGLDWFLPKETS